MTYQSIKRVLGETSLERKCRFLFGGYLLLLITASFWWYGSQMEQLLEQENRNTGRLLVDRAMYIKHWESLETNEQFLPLVQELTEKLSKEQYEWNVIQPSSASEQGKPRDEFEWQVLDRFRDLEPEEIASDTPPFAERPLPERQQYQYYQPIYADSSSCVVCHNAMAVARAAQLGTGSELNEGDLMAVVKVTIPTGKTQKALNWNRAVLLATAIVTVFLAMVASYAIVRYVIVKPLRHLRDVSDQISRGNISLRADIHTGDEFELLAVAFNRMLRHLVTIQEELRQVNADLDGKVDELAQVNMRLYELNTIKSDFLATMSHELRTPLNSILGFSEVLGSIDSLNDKQKRYVSNIQNSGRTLLEMINDILDLAKMESGRMEARPADFRIGQLIHAQCDMVRPLSEKKNIDLETRIEPDLPAMYQDQARVQQVINNLLSNAIKFTPEGGRVRISARREPDGDLLMQVEDTGVGIAEEDQQAIFEKFRQGRTGLPGDDAMTREYSGTGLGLSIVKEICKLLGGEVSVQSELGKGSTFTVRLPWELDESSHLRATLPDGFDELTRSRYEFARNRTSPETGVGTES